MRSWKFIRWKYKFNPILNLIKMRLTKNEHGVLILRQLIVGLLKKRLQLFRFFFFLL